MLARLPRIVVILLVVAFTASAAWRMLAPTGQIRKAAPGHYTDMMLYRDIVGRMQAGDGYYQAAAQTQRAHHYPTRPFVTMRLPTLYWLGARLGWERLNLISKLLLAANLAAWGLALAGRVTIAERLGMMAGIWFGGLAAISLRLAPMSETWCGLLIGLALAARIGWRERWWLTLVPIALALSLRELALPFAALAGAFALWERRWSELAGWTGLVLLFGLGLALHADAVAAAARPGDLSSQGWNAMLGLRGVLLALVHTSWLHNLPRQLAMIAALLPALGWLALTGRAGHFAALLLGGYALLLALFARPDNFYWGFLLLPTWFAGWALLPRAGLQLRDAWRADLPLVMPRLTWPVRSTPG